MNAFTSPFQNKEDTGERSISLPPTQKVGVVGNSLERSIETLPPSGNPMQGSSQPSASGSDVDTQLIFDLMESRADTYGPDGEEILSILQPPAACSMTYSQPYSRRGQATYILKSQCRFHRVISHRITGIIRR